MEQMLRPPEKRGVFSPILIEMTIVILFLALSTSVVVRLIAVANITAQQSAYESRAILAMERVAEQVKAALHRSVRCDTLDGIKRRVRPGMGRCQGGFCGPLVLQIIAEETGLPLEQIDKSEAGGEVLFGSIKEVRAE